MQNLKQTTQHEIAGYTINNLLFVSSNWPQQAAVLAWYQSLLGRYKVKGVERGAACSRRRLHWYGIALSMYMQTHVCHHNGVPTRADSSIRSFHPSSSSHQTFITPVGTKAFLFSFFFSLLGFAEEGCPRNSPVTGANKGDTNKYVWFESESVHSFPVTELSNVLVQASITLRIVHPPDPC